MSQGKLNVFICLLHCKKDRIMSQDKLNVFICLLHCKIESCHNVNWMYLFVYYYYIVR